MEGGSAAGAPVERLGARDTDATARPEEGTQQVEAELRSRLRGVRLAVELGLDERDLRRLRALVIGLTRGLSDPPARMASRYPAIYVAYLVAEGVFYYRVGSFWDHVISALRDQQNDPGYCFLVALRELGLEDFERLVIEDRAMPYVSRILAHGGIPASCLPDFFRMLAAELRRGHADASGLLASWRTSRARLESVHKPARRFLLYGGDPAVDLLDRCVDLIGESTRRREVPTADEAGLPQYVVDAYAALPRHEARADRHQAGLPRPALVLDPYDGLGPTIELPSVSSGAAGTWRVRDGQSTDEEPASALAPASVRVVPSRSWEVEFDATDGAARSWVFEGFDRYPALFLDPANGRAVRDPAVLRLDSAWVLAPATWRLGSQGGDGSTNELRDIEELPTPTGAWASFSLRHVDLEGARVLELRDLAHRRHTVAVVAPRARPSLIEEAIEGVTTPDGCPVFASLPRIAVPVLAEVSGAGWRFRLRRGEQSVAFEAPEEVDRGEVSLEGHLDGPDFGLYALSARGPLGSDLSATFAVVPKLRVRRPSHIIRPGEADPELFVAAEGPIGIDGSDPGTWRKLALPQGGDATECMAHGPSGQSLALRVRVARLVWAITHETKPAVAPSAHVLKIGVEEFEDELADVLTVRTGRPGTELELVLEDRARRVIQRVERGLAAGAAGRWSFDLAPFADTIRRSEDAGLSLHLLVNGFDVRVADLVARVEVEAIRARSRLAGDFAAVSVSFDEARTINGRVARLWSLHRPWEGPIVEQIADGERQVEVSGYARVPPGPYVAEIALDDAWIAPRRPRAGEANCAAIRVGAPEDEDAYLSKLSASEPLAVLERALATGILDERPAAEARSSLADPAAVAMDCLLSQLSLGQAASPGLRAARAVLCADADTLLGGIVSAVARGEVDSESSTRISLRALRQARALEAPEDEHLLSEAWELCPILAAAFDIPRSSSDSLAAARCERFLGCDPHEAPIDVSGGRVTQNEAGRTAAELRAARRFIGLLPQGELEPEALMVANFEWVIDQVEADDAPAGTRVGDHPAGWLESSRWLAEELPWEGSESGRQLNEHLDARRPPRGTFPWAELPIVTLAAAAKVTAEGPDRRHARAALEAALAFAPRLVRHDLLLCLVLAESLEPVVRC